MVTSGGLRERKKAATRQALHRAAVRLFAERGFDAVTLAEVADAADVAVTTLFSYYPGGKVALVFDRDEDRAAAILGAARGRGQDTDVIDAVRDFIASRLPIAATEDETLLLGLVAETPALREHARRKWIECQDVLAEVLEEERVADGPLAQALARFLLETPGIVGSAPEPRAALDAIVGNLRRGWTRSPVKDAAPGSRTPR